MFAKYEITRDNNDNLYFSKNKINTCLPHFHKHVELLYIEKGSKFVTINDKSLTLTDSQLAVADSFDIHSFPFSSEISSSVLIIPYFYLNDYINYKGKLYLSDNFITDRKKGNEIYSVMDRLGNSLKLNSLFLRGLISEIMGMILEEIPLTEKSKEEDMEFIRNLIVYIENNLDGDITLENLSFRFGYSKYHFSRLFNSYFKCNLKDYINSNRLKKFIGILTENPDCKLTEAIFSCGFTSVQSFYRCFKNVYQSTPKEYIKKTGQGQNALTLK